MWRDAAERGPPLYLNHREMSKVQPRGKIRLRLAGKHPDHARCAAESRSCTGRWFNRPATKDRCLAQAPLHRRIALGALVDWHDLLAHWLADVLAERTKQPVI